jgi:tight adherence protein C
MFSLGLETMTVTTMLIAIASAVAVFGAIVSIAMPYLAKDELGSRMKSVALERDQIRARERARLASQKNSRGNVTKVEPKAYVRNLVDSLNLRTALADEKTTQQLIQAGLRGQNPLFVFLFLRVVLPLIFFIVTAIYMFVLGDSEHGLMTKMLISLIGAYVGFYAPIIYVKNKIKSRTASIQKAWPDTLDLTLICVESGMSIEAAFRKVSTEIGKSSIPLAEELILTTAELSFLSDRRVAYENFAARTGMDTVRNVVTALIQAERYGTPLGSALRVLSAENRELRMMAAETKAAALPPKLTVPMILFFLPVLFAVVLTPAIMSASGSGF